VLTWIALVHGHTLSESLPPLSQSCILSTTSNYALELPLDLAKGCEGLLISGDLRVVESNIVRLSDRLSRHRIDTVGAVLHQHVSLGIVTRTMDRI